MADMTENKEPSVQEKPESPLKKLAEKLRTKKAAPEASAGENAPEEPAAEAAAAETEAVPAAEETAEPAQADAPKKAEKSPDGVVSTKEEAKEKAKARKKKSAEIKSRARLRNRILLAAAGLVVLIYLGIGFYFSRHFLPHTAINGVTVDQMNAEDAQAALEDASTHYVLKVKNTEGETEEIHGEKLELRYTNGTLIDDLINEQKAFTWIAHLQEEKNFTVNFNASYNEQELTREIQALQMFDEDEMIAPEDAYIEQTDEGMYEIVPEVLGTTIWEGPAEDEVKKAVSMLSPEVDLKQFQILPEIYSDNEELNEHADAWNSYFEADGLTFAYFDGDEVVDKEMIASILVDDDGEISIDEDRVAEIVDDWTADHDTYGREWEFESSNGDTVTISDRGNYGFESDWDDTYETFLSRLEEKSNEDVEVEYLHEGDSHENKGLGGSYVEISLDDQHMWVYDDYELIASTGVITGQADVASMRSDPGCYYIYAKQRNRTLGNMKTTGYECFVKYFMPYNGGEGIHDADWRGSGEFGTNAYKWDGSHGCINTPPSIMPTIYEHAYVGMPVIVY